MANTDSQSAASTPERAALDFKVEAFEPRHLPLVTRFSEQYWSRPRSTSYYDWRYLQSIPFSRMFLAHGADVCLGLVFAFRKSYLIGGTLTPCLEMFDWHTLPGLSGSGVGLRLVRALLRENIRLFGVGGTADALRVLPAMGWETVAETMNFELPTSGQILEEGLHRRIPFRIPGARTALNAVSSIWFQPRPGPSKGRVLPVATIGPEIDALYEGDTGYGIVQKPDPALQRWLTTGWAGAGSFQYLYFMIDDRVRGWAMTRTYETEHGPEAALVEIFAPKPDVDLYGWMVSEAARSLMGARPRVIRARASCPILKAALFAHRFRAGTPVPVFTWPKMGPREATVHITLNHTDAPLRPYPSWAPWRDARL